MIYGIKEPPNAPDEATWPADLLPCDPASYPSGNSGACWQMPRAPWEAPRRPLAKCAVVVVETVGVEMKEVA